MGKLIQGENDLETKCPGIAAEWHPTKNGSLTPKTVAYKARRKVWWVCPTCKSEYEAFIYNRAVGNGCPYCSGKRVKAGYNDLSTKLPTVAAEWHPTKNGDLTPADVTCKSNKKVWWLCSSCNNEYETTISSRERGSGCPFCSGNRVKAGFNDLATKYPEVAAEWHPTKNGNLTPADVSSGSNKRVWWLCPSCNSEYEAVVAGRTNGSGCPYCTGKKIKAGFNDLATKYPEVAAEWHPTKNGDLTPAHVTCGTHRKVWWICENGHEWRASVAKRSSGGRGCPYCSNKMVLPGFNDMESKCPELAAEWHPTKNGDLHPDGVTWGSNKKVWWLCPKCGFEYQAVINKRTRSGEGCPCCGPITKQIMVGFNDLGTTHPELVAEWHPTKNGELTPRAVSFGSNKSVWWECPTCSSDYEARIADRVNGNGCPYCAGKRIKSGFNDLATRYPDVAAEWHPTKNGNLKPSNVFPRSMKKYWWKCSRCGNEWKASPDSRINRMSCPECSFYTHTSFPEQAVLYYLKKAFPDAQGRNRDFGFELDIVIPSKNAAVEYDGVFYHAKNRAFGVSDEKKDKLCLDNGITLYRIRENGLDPTSSAVCIERNNLSNEDLDECIIKLLQYLDATVDVSVDRDQPAILAQYNTFIHDNSLQTVNPQLASEWHPTKNGSLSPENVPAGSGKKAWWLCPVCHGEWKTRIVERNQGRGCPYCANQKVLVGFNDLASRNPQMAAEWHPTKNGDLSPANVISTSNRKVWWLCKTCHHEWQSSISSRARYNLGCPKCGAERGRVTQRKNKIKKGTPTFSEAYPELAAEWHPTKNGELKPGEVTYHSGLEVWWKCSICGREWKQRIWNRARYNATGCSICRRKVVSKQQIKGKESYLTELAKIHPNVEIVGEYINSNTKVKCRCHKCGHEWSVLPYSLLRQKYGCPNCSKTERGQSRRKDPEAFVKELKTINPSVEPLEKYSTSTRKILCRCLKCGNEWMVAPSKLLSGRGCPVCSRNRASEKQKTTHQAFLSSLYEINSSIDVLEEYVNAKTPILCQCSKCGHRWNATPSNLLRGTGCPRCARTKEA